MNGVLLAYRDRRLMFPQASVRDLLGELIDAIDYGFIGQFGVSRDEAVKAREILIRLESFTTGGATHY